MCVCICVYECVTLYGKTEGGGGGDKIQELLEG